MQKRNKLFKSIVLLMLIFATTLCGCSCNNEKDTNKFTIYYTDNGVTQSLTVTKGSPYKLEKLPEKFGYEFLGLFSEIEGGFKLVDEKGYSIDVFSENKNMVLYPQYKAKDYTLNLDYQGAEITNVNSLSVSYDAEIPALPTNLTKQYKVFMGWYTEPNCNGNKIYGVDGVVPENNVVNKKVFEDLTTEDNSLYLYAGFENEKYSVIFHFENDITEEMQIEYGTDIKNVLPKTRVDGKSVLQWSTVKNDINKNYIFDGIITGVIDLYALEYAPVIDFNSNGGEKIKPIVAKENTSITLPTPVRENYKFFGWFDENEIAYTSTLMPQNSKILKAKWQAILVLDENGGSDVDNISTVQGEKITLPTPEKMGYFFAGWYTTDKTKYDITTMPSESVILKAGWYKEEKANMILNLEDAPLLGKGESFTSHKVLDLSDIITDYNVFIKISLMVSIENEKQIIPLSDVKSNTTISVYNDDKMLEENLQFKIQKDVESNKFEDEITGNVLLKNKKLHLTNYIEMKKQGGISKIKVYLKITELDIYYPDTSRVYLD